MGKPPKSSTQTILVSSSHGDLGIPHFKKPPNRIHFRKWGLVNHFTGVCQVIFWGERKEDHHGDKLFNIYGGSRKIWFSEYVLTVYTSFCPTDQQNSELSG